MNAHIVCARRVDARMVVAHMVDGHSYEAHIGVARRKTGREASGHTGDNLRCQTESPRTHYVHNRAHHMAEHTTLRKDEPVLCHFLLCFESPHIEEHP